MDGRKNGLTNVSWSGLSLVVAAAWIAVGASGQSRAKGGGVTTSAGSLLKKGRIAPKRQFIPGDGVCAGHCSRLTCLGVYILVTEIGTNWNILASAAKRALKHELDGRLPL
jgi:hypothetical protein